MDELENFLRSRNLDLDTDDDDDLGEQELSDSSVWKSSHYRRETVLERESHTESILSHDRLAPNIVHFSSSYYLSTRKRQRLLSGLIAVVLSVMGLIHFSKSILSFSLEEPLDIDAEMKVEEGFQNATTNAAISVADADDNPRT